LSPPPTGKRWLELQALGEDSGTEGLRLRSAFTDQDDCAMAPAMLAPGGGACWIGAFGGLRSNHRNKGLVLIDAASSAKTFMWEKVH